MMEGGAVHGLVLVELFLEQHEQPHQCHSSRYHSHPNLGSLEACGQSALGTAARREGA